VRLNLIFFILAYGLAYSQPSLHNVFEEPVQSDNQLFMATSGERYILLYRLFNLSEGISVDYIPVADSLSVNKNRPNHGAFRLEPGSTLLNTLVRGHSIHFLSRQVRTRDLNLYSVHPDSSTYTVRTFRSAVAVSSLFFAVSDHYAVTAGYLQGKPAALYCDFRDGTAKVLPGFFNRNGEINDLKVYPDGRMDILLALHLPNTGKSMVLQRYAADGKLIQTVVLSSGTGRRLIQGKFHRTEGDTILVAGTYGRTPEYSRGIFISHLLPGGEYTMRFYNYGDLRNYFRFLPDRREQRVKERIKRRKDKGKPIRYPIRMLIHEFRPDQDGIHLLGEAVQPVYRSGAVAFYRSVNTGEFAFIRPYYSSQRDAVFDGFRYSHAVDLCVKKDGTLRWDHSLELKNIRTFTLRQYTVRKTVDDASMIAYATPEALIAGKYQSEDGTGKEGIVKPAGLNTLYSQVIKGPGNRLFVTGVRDKVIIQGDQQVRQRTFFVDELKP